MLAALLASLSFAVEPAEWNKDEAVHLKNIAQVTKDYVRAGEGYFSPDGKMIIYQAEEKGTGNPFYQIFTTDLATGRTRRVSPGVGKTTCSYFSPDGKKVLFASSHLDPRRPPAGAAVHRGFRAAAGVTNHRGTETRRRPKEERRTDS